MYQAGELPETRRVSKIDYEPPKTVCKTTFASILPPSMENGDGTRKPDLHLYDFKHKDYAPPALRAIGSANNILMDGGGVGVYADPYGNASCRSRQSRIPVLS